MSWTAACQKAHYRPEGLSPDIWDTADGWSCISQAVNIYNFLLDALCAFIAETLLISFYSMWLLLRAFGCCDIDHGECNVFTILSYRLIELERCVMGNVILGDQQVTECVFNMYITIVEHSKHIL